MQGRKSKLAVCAGAAVLLCATTATGQDAPALVGTDGPDVLNGTPATEALYGLGGDDTLNGGAGDDTLDGGAGADQIHGGPGQDAVSYASSATGVKVTLDDQPGDGAPGENDNVGSDVEDIYSGAGNDILVGSSAANVLDGGAGDDQLTGGGGSDGLFGGDGDDTILAQDGVADRIDCGPGTDIANVDAVDFTIGCERTTIPARPSVKYGFKNGKPITTKRVAQLQATNVAPGATITVNCTGGGCPIKITQTITAKSATVSLLKIFAGAQLKPGAKITITLAVPNTAKRTFIYTVSKLAVKETVR